MQVSVEHLTAANNSLKDKLYEQRESLNAQVKALKKSAAEATQKYEEEKNEYQSYLSKVVIYVVTCILTFINIKSNL